MVMSVVRVAAMIRKNLSICMISGGIVWEVVLVLIVALLLSINQSINRFLLETT